MGRLTADYSLPTESGGRRLEPAVENCVSVARAEGHKTQGDTVVRVRDIVEAAGVNRLSMLSRCGPPNRTGNVRWRNRSTGVSSL